MKPRTLTLPGLDLERPLAAPHPTSWQVFVRGVILRGSAWWRAHSSPTRRGASDLEFRKREHSAWTVWAFEEAFPSGPPGLPVRVTIVRITPVVFEDENDARASRDVMAGVAQWLGVSPEDPGIAWEFAQRNDGIRVGVEVCIVRVGGGV